MEEIFEPRPRKSPNKAMPDDGMTSLDTTQNARQIATNATAQSCAEQSDDKAKPHDAVEQKDKTRASDGCAATARQALSSPTSILSSKRKDHSCDNGNNVASGGKCVTGNGSSKAPALQPGKQSTGRASAPAARKVNWESNILETTAAATTNGPSAKSKLVILPRTNQYEPHSLLQQKAASGMSRFDELTGMLRSQRAADAAASDADASLAKRRGISMDDGGGGARLKTPSLAAMAKKQMSLDSGLALRQMQAATDAAKPQPLRLEPRGAFHERNPLLDVEEFLNEAHDAKPPLKTAEQPTASSAQPAVTKPKSRRHSEQSTSSAATTAAAHKRSFFMIRLGSISLEPRVNQYEKHALLESRDEQGLSPLDYFLSEKDEQVRDEQVRADRLDPDRLSIEQDADSTSSKGKCSERCMCKNPACTVCKPQHQTPKQQHLSSVSARDQNNRSDSSKTNNDAKSHKIPTDTAHGQQNSSQACAVSAATVENDLDRKIRPKIMKQTQIEDSASQPPTIADSNSHNLANDTRQIEAALSGRRISADETLRACNDAAAAVAVDSCSSAVPEQQQQQQQRCDDDATQLSNSGCHGNGDTKYQASSEQLIALSDTEQREQHGCQAAMDINVTPARLPGNDHAAVCAGDGTQRDSHKRVHFDHGANDQTASVTAAERTNDNAYDASDVDQKQLIASSKDNDKKRGSSGGGLLCCRSAQGVDSDACEQSSRAQLTSDRAGDQAKCSRNNSRRSCIIL